ncbi:molybdopterin cofactor-binding domain-containing protein [Spongiimicrobium sp. 3-5]|uniref:xanthine dehydrogenase family protein molybdopterin-binding subunit n=1 Tax=Spongiimicrobium sp. 3-5 TaxID=3332596 RepID=UPI00398000B4
MERRNFFRITALSGGGILLGTFIPLGCAGERKVLPDWEPNFFIKISPDNSITFVSSQSELGQGTSTGLAMIAADELGVSMEDLKIEFGIGSTERYGHLQGTGGSNGVRILWQPLREAMATTREILISAAAQKWGVSTTECYSEQGHILHKDQDWKIPFGDLLDIAVTLNAPQEIKLKDPSEFKYIGKPIIGPKAAQAATGSTPFSINVKLPDMLYAGIARCPVWGGELVSFNADKALAIPGVVEVLEVEPTEVQPDDYKGGVRPGVAVLATNTWAAFEGKKALEIVWEKGKNGSKSDIDIRQELIDGRMGKREVSSDINGAKALFRRGRRFVSATYDSPYQVNACMEPLNATAYHRGHKVEIWAGTQAPQLNQQRIAELTGLPQAAITVHNQPSGGGFGRRYFCDYVEEAVILSDKVRRPVKVTWSREDTFSTSKYHPYCKDYWEAALDEDNMPISLVLHGTVSRPSGYRPYPYSIPLAYNHRLRYKEGNLLPRASWRSVFAHPWGLGLESFMDELAHSANKDPVQFRLDLLEKAKIVEQKELPWVGDDLYPQKLKKTLEIAAEKSGWGKQGENGIYQGVSALGYNTSYCSQVVDVSLENDQLKIVKITAVIDCGLAINPNQVKAQIEGSILWGLSALLKGSITVKDGEVQQDNYDTYDLLRIHETPDIDVFIVDSNEAPTGTGEPAVPGVAPAVLNAVFAATGKRIRALPVPQGLFKT